MHNVNQEEVVAVAVAVAVEDHQMTARLDVHQAIHQEANIPCICQTLMTAQDSTHVAMEFRGKTSVLLVSSWFDIEFES